MHRPNPNPVPAQSIARAAYVRRLKERHDDGTLVPTCERMEVPDALLAILFPRMFPQYESPRCA